MRSDTKTIVDAMRILARDVESDDGVANTAMLEAANRLEELNEMLSQEWGRLNQEIDTDGHYGHSGSYPLSDSLEIDEDVPGWVADEVRRLESINADLLEALEHAVAIYGRFGGVVNDPNNPGEWIEKAKNAIAIAKRVK